MTVVVGTAGHIDHGKTSLLRALTGIDADRLPEERRRGMTIDVGYAHLRLPDGEELDFVDVPGHDRLVGNMLVGAGEVDAVLLVVAADDGPRAQTLEHLELVDALGIDIGVVAISKIDMVDPARVAEVQEQIGELLRRTRLVGSPVVPVSSESGDGVEALRDALIGLRDRARGRSGGTSTHPRLAVDRVFAIRGRGTVVTGSLRGGPIRKGQALTVVPGGEAVRVREIQVHDATVEAAGGGGRVALNIAGELDPPPHRGDTLTTDPAVGGTSDLLVVLHASAGLESVAGSRRGWPLAAGAAVRVHLGTAAVDGRIRRGRRDTVALPDGRQVVRLRLERPLAAAAGDRFVLRRPSPGLTLAGGVVLDTTPPMGVSARRVTPARIVRLVEAGAADVAREEALLELHGARVTFATARAAPAVSLAPEVASELQDAAVAVCAVTEGVSLADARPQLVRALRRAVTIDTIRATTVVDTVIAGLVEQGRLARTGDRLHPPGPLAGEGPLDPAIVAAMDRLERILEVPAPPPLPDAIRLAGGSADTVRRLIREGRVISLDDDLAYAATTFAGLEAAALDLARVGPLTPSAFRDATGTSRRYVMAILEELDRRGILARTPAGHVPGPRAPR